MPQRVHIGPPGEQKIVLEWDESIGANGGLAVIDEASPNELAN